MKILMTAVIVLALAATQSSGRDPATVILKTPRRAVQIDHFFFETARGRTPLPTELTHGVLTVSNRRWTGEAMTADGEGASRMLEKKNAGTVEPYEFSPAKPVD